MCARFAENERDLIAFLRTTFWACSFLICAAIFNAIVNPSTGFENGRLGRSPTSLSVIAGIITVIVAYVEGLDEVSVAPCLQWFLLS